MKVSPFLLIAILTCVLFASPVAVFAGDGHGNPSNNGNNGNGGNNNGNNGNGNSNNNENNNNGNGNGWSWDNTNVAWHHQNGDHQYCNHGNHQQAPFDGGFTLLVGAGLAYGIKRARDQRKKLLPQTNA